MPDQFVMVVGPIAGLTTIIDVSTCCNWIYNTQCPGLLRIGIKDSRESIMSRTQMMSHSKRKCNLFKHVHMNANANANGNTQGNASVQGENAKFYVLVRIYHFGSVHRVLLGVR